MKPTLLICTDLDRTLLPNGHLPESPGVRDTFARLVARDEIDLAYLSGRDLHLVVEAMEAYRIPRPRFIIGDVGTSIYESIAGEWRPSASWRQAILRDWAGRPPGRMMGALESIDALVPQEPEKQSAAKISFYTAVDADRSEVEEWIAGRLDVAFRLVWSTDEIERRGLLDILPPSAGKLQAIEFLIETHGYRRDRTIFAGDSGNDLEVLAGSLYSVLVANADEKVRSLAVEMAARQGNGDTLHQAAGGFLGTNGNYAAGILEGVAHFFPETVRWMKER
jgi:hypothetical protein